MYTRIGWTMLNFWRMFGILLLSAHFVVEVENVLATAWTPTEIDERLEPQVEEKLTERNIMDYDLHFDPIGRNDIYSPDFAYYTAK